MPSSEQVVLTFLLATLTGVLLYLTRYSNKGRYNSSATDAITATFIRHFHQENDCFRIYNLPAFSI